MRPEQKQVSRLLVFNSNRLERDRPCCPNCSIRVLFRERVIYLFRTIQPIPLLSVEGKVLRYADASLSEVGACMGDGEWQAIEEIEQLAEPFGILKRYQSGRLVPCTGSEQVDNAHHL